MNIDFPLILVLATFATGVIWAADAWIAAPKRRASASRAGDPEDARAVLKEPVAVEYAKAFFPVILIVLILRSFLVEPFRIPSGSMIPTLLIGDFILVNKYSYGIRLPVLNSKVVEIGEPKRGDVVVFRYPEDPSIDYIKRVVGLPGDRIDYRDKALYVNGRPMVQQSRGTYIGTGAAISSSGSALRLESLGDVEHEILVRPNSGGIEGSVVVPDGHYFMMGDNRDNSKDSRYFGPVPERNLVGRAFMIWMSWDSADTSINWQRIGERIH